MSNVFKVRADGSGREEAVTSSATSLYPISVAADGSKAIVVQSPESGPQTLGLLDLVDRGKTTALLTDRTARIINGELSPDSHWLAYQSNETGAEVIYVRPFPNVDGPKIPIGAGTKPAWC
jgi:Tol biopolymer transport system component